MISDLFSVIKLVLDLVTKQDTDRRGIADLLDKIADSMWRAIEPASKGEPISEQHMHEFLIYCENFDKIVDGTLTQKTRKDLSEMLRKCAIDDRAYSETMRFEEMTLLGEYIQNATRFNHEFQDVIRGIGQLKAYANMLRAYRGAV